MSLTSSVEAVRESIDLSPMSRTQIIAIAILSFLSALDGFDVLAVTFAAPGVGTEFEATRADLGIVLAIGLLGMGLGSLLLAPIADHAGRKPVVVASLLLMGGGMAGCVAARDLNMLIAWRLVTGLGIGAMVATIAPLAAEFANARWRSLAIAIMTLGYPLGGVIGGGAAAILLQHHDWRSVFMVGVVSACLALPIVMLWLPESISYLLTRTKGGSLQRINRALGALNRPRLDRLPQSPAKSHPPRAAHRHNYGALAHVTAINFLFAMAVYYILSWMPQMVADAGFSEADATRVSVMASFCGVLGGLLLGWAAAHMPLKPLVVTAFAGLGVAIALFGATPPNLLWLSLAAGATGFFLYPGAVGAYNVATASFPAASRATGVGIVVGIGRGGSALAPLIAGFMFSNGFERTGVSAVMAAAAILAGLLLVFLPLKQQPAHE